VIAEWLTKVNIIVHLPHGIQLYADFACGRQRGVVHYASVDGRDRVTNRQTNKQTNSVALSWKANYTE
jgi:hypothetical protein